MARRVLKRIGAGLAVAVVLLLVYGAAIEPRLILDERRYRAELPRLAADAPTTRIAVFSDLQLGAFWANTGMVERVVDRVVAERPDAVLLAGDFLYSTDPDPNAQVDHTIQLITPLVKAGLPTFAVLGNHDYHVEAAEQLTAALRNIGVTVLRNDAAPLPTARTGDHQPVWVVGIGPKWPGHDDVDQALRAVPADAPRVVLMHNPSTFPRLPAGTAPLAVAGHTHCGQVAVPGTPRWSYLQLIEDQQVVVDGFAPDDYGASGNTLFVTCGIGFSSIPVRINAPPQLVFFDLVPAANTRPTG